MTRSESKSSGSNRDASKAVRPAPAANAVGGTGGGVDPPGGATGNGRDGLYAGGVTRGTNTSSSSVGVRCGAPPCVPRGAADRGPAMVSAPSQRAGSEAEDRRPHREQQRREHRHAGAVAEREVDAVARDDQQRPHEQRARRTGSGSSRTSQPDRPPSCSSTTWLRIGTHAFHASSPDLRNTADSASAVQT